MRNTVERSTRTTELPGPGMLATMWKALRGGCTHEDYTVPMRLPGGTGVTVSCLQCATRLRYDWDRMRVARGQ